MRINLCPICSCEKSAHYLAMKDYRLTRCLRCRMVWDSDPPIDTHLIYQEDYYKSKSTKGGYSNYFEDMKLNRKTFSYRLASAHKKLGYKGLLLDVGCALGDCIIQADELGWHNPIGIEVSNYAVNFAKGRRLKVFYGDLLNHSFQPESFDLIMLQDVIEHTSNPICHLKAAYELLKPKGWIFIATPNIEGFWRRLLGSYWYHYKPNEHLTYFSKNTINLALKNIGFRNIESKVTINFMSLEYVISRLKYYQATLFSALHKISQTTNIGKLVFPLNIDEIEAWAQK